MISAKFAVPGHNLWKNCGGKSRNLWTKNRGPEARISLDLNGSLSHIWTWKFAAYLLSGRPDRRSRLGRCGRLQIRSDAKRPLELSAANAEFCSPVKVAYSALVKRRACRVRRFGGGFGDAQHGEALQSGSQSVESAPGLSGDLHRSCGRSEGSLG